MLDKKRRKPRGLGGLVVTLVCALLAFLIFLNRQYIVDQISVWQFTPSAEVAGFTDRSGMSDRGEFYFYTSHPTLSDAKAFNGECDRKESNIAVLGCYNGRYIYIYNVTDVKLEGIREVTAAHEMLHVVYARLGDSEKQRVDELLETEYAKLKDDPRFAERMAFYARTEPGQRGNELHSVIGTEVANVSSELSEYYQSYFTDRNKVVALHAQYQAIFAELQSRGEALSTQLTQLGNKIESESSQYNKDTAQFNQDVEQFNERAKSGVFTSQTAFNAERAALLARASQLDARRVAINADIIRYNELRAELATVASQSQALNRSIDSSLAPPPSL